MELVWLVYLISVLGSLKPILLVFLTMSTMAALVMWFAIIIDPGVKPKVAWIWSLAALVLSLVTVVVPSEETAYLMVSAYATQKIAEMPETKELATDVLTIIQRKVKQYAAEEGVKK